MRHGLGSAAGASSVALVLAMSCSSAGVRSSAPASSTADSASLTPLLKQLPRFTSPGVPCAGTRGDRSSGAAVGRAYARPACPGKGWRSIRCSASVRATTRSSRQRRQDRLDLLDRAGWEYDDVWMLSNGNVLFTRMQYVAEVTPEKQVVWRYDAPEGRRFTRASRSGSTGCCSSINGLPPKLMVVNIRTNTVEVEHDLLAPSLTDPKTVHAQFRRARFTPQGTYLVPVPHDEPGRRVRHGLQRDLALRHHEPVGGGSVEERQHADHRRARHAHARGHPGQADRVAAPRATCPERTDTSTPRARRGWQRQHDHASRGGDGRARSSSR